MTEHDPPRMRELPDSELGGLLDAAERDVAPRDVLSRSAERLSAAIGVSVGDITSLGPAPMDAATSALASKSTVAASSTTVTATKSAATAAAATSKTAAVLAPALSAAVKPLLVVALASATTVAVWRAQPETSAAPAGGPAAPVAAPDRITSLRAHPNIDPNAATEAPIAAPAPLSQTTARDAPATAPAQRANALRIERRAQPVPRRDPRAAESSLPSAPSSAAAEELRSLQAAQAELVSRPVSAVRRLREHAAKWPQGWLDEERAALLVEALLHAGDGPGAARALEELRIRNPRSPALPRLGRMLAQDTVR